MFIFEVETWDEDIYVLDYLFIELKDAIKEAKKIAYKYKTISIVEVDEDGNNIKEYDIDGEVQN